MQNPVVSRLKSRLHLKLVLFSCSSLAPNFMLMIFRQLYIQADKSNSMEQTLSELGNFSLWTIYCKHNFLHTLHLQSVFIFLIFLPGCDAILDSSIGGQARVNLGPRVFSGNGRWRLTKTLVKFISSPPDFGEKIACAVRLNVCCWLKTMLALTISQTNYRSLVYDVKIRPTSVHSVNFPRQIFPPAIRAKTEVRQWPILKNLTV